jgi:methionyl-tRNA formyltransferase
MPSLPRILFLGTPEFAVPSLEIILAEGYPVAAVVTAPDKPSGRGLQLNSSAVKRFALAHGLKILQPEKLKNEEFLNEVKSLAPDLGVVVAFRKMPEALWALPRLGTFNLHASLLPDYRGAAPINRAIMNGETETGLTTFFLSQEIDTGKIILQQKMQIGENESAGELHDRMKTAGAQLVALTMKKIFSGDFQLKDQPRHGELKPAPKIFSSDCKIDFSQSATRIHHLIRGLSPYPAAFMMLKDKQLKIFRARPVHQIHSQQAGSVSTDGKTFFRLACADGWIDVFELQLEGKKKMNTEEFLRGFRPDSFSS